ncbi:hypothetical protein D3C78_1894090 [compost metagenome]
MGGVEEEIDALLADVLRQAFRAAKTADTNLAPQIRRHPTDTGQAIDVLWPQCAGDGQGFGHTAEQQDSFH